MTTPNLFNFIYLMMLFGAQGATASAVDDQAACAALLEMPDVTLTSYVMKPALCTAPRHCYVKGNIQVRIRFHIQLPMRADWNGKLVNIGDGGKDGDLDFADNYVAEGYATANSNMGHDVGSTPGASFAYENLESIID